MRSVLLLSLVACNSGLGGDTGSPDRATCELYVDCVGQVSASELGEVIDAYGPEGSCWSGDSDLATTCYEACDAGLTSMRELTDESACWPEGCGEFMAAWNDCAEPVLDERYCADDLDAWRSCLAPRLADGCDAPTDNACNDLRPLADSAVYRPGFWVASWGTQTDDCESETTDLGEYLHDEVQIEGAGDGPFEVTLDFGVATQSIDCTLDGTSFACTETVTNSQGSGVVEFDGSFDDTGSASGTYVASVEASESCSVTLPFTLTYAQ